MRTPRPLLLLTACLLTVALASGSALPSPWLWRCRHASRVVAAPFAAAPPMMPCRVGGAMAMHGPMACCSVSRTGKSHGSSPRQALGRPGCRPMLVSMAAPPVAQAHRTDTHLRQCLASAFAFGALPMPTVARSPITLSLRQRPPPGGVFPSAAPPRPRLRAPPAA